MRTVERTYVASSVIASLGYDGGKKVLEVEFRTGRVYRYFGVPERVYRELRTAPSIGSYFNRQIKDRFRAAAVTAP